MTWSEIAGSGLHTWLVIAALAFLAIMVVRAGRMSDQPSSNPAADGQIAASAALDQELAQRAARLNYRRPPLEP